MINPSNIRESVWGTTANSAPQTIHCFIICYTFTPSVGSFTSPGTPDRRGEWLIMSHLKDTCRQSEVNEKATEGLNV